MSTPQDRIPKPDATSVNRPRERDPNVGWREFVRQFIPKGIRDIVLPGTEEAREGRERRRIDETIPYGKEFPYASESREREIDRLFDQEQAGFEPVASDLELGRYGKMYEGIVPEDVRENISGALGVPFKAALGPAGGLIESTPLSLIAKVPLGEVLKGAADVSGVSGLVSGESPFEMIEGPVGGMATGAIPFGQKLYNRIDKAAEAFGQNKATGAQWLKELTTGVPEQERAAISDVLKGRLDQMFNKDEIVNLQSRVYETPIIEEVRRGGSNKILESRKEIGGGDSYSNIQNAQYGEDYKVLYDESKDRWDLYDISGDLNWSEGRSGYVKSFSTRTTAEEYIGRLTEAGREYPKWEHITIPGGKNYEEIVLTTPQGGVYTHDVHHPNVDNPVLHLRLKTREAIIPNPKKREFEILEDGSGAISYGDDVIIENYGDKFSVVHKGRYIYDTGNLDEAVQFVKNNISSDLEAQKLTVRQLEELQSDWAQQIRKARMEGGKGVRPKTIEEMPDIEFREVAASKEFGYPSHFAVKYEGESYRIFPLGLIKPSRTKPARNAPRYSIENTIGHNYYVDTFEEVEKHIKTRSYIQRSPDMVFSQTDQWVDLGLERAIQNAIDEGVDVLTWASGELQYTLSGTNVVKWGPPGYRKLNTVEKEALKNKHVIRDRTKNIQNIKDVREIGYTLDEAKYMVVEAFGDELRAKGIDGELVDRIMANRIGISESFFDDIVEGAWSDEALRRAIDAGPFRPNEGPPTTQHQWLSEAQIELAEDYLKIRGSHTPNKEGLVNFTELNEIIQDVEIDLGEAIYPADIEDFLKLSYDQIDDVAKTEPSGPLKEIATRMRKLIDDKLDSMNNYHLTQKETDELIKKYPTEKRLINDAWNMNVQELRSQLDDIPKTLASFDNQEHSLVTKMVNDRKDVLEDIIKMKIEGAAKPRFLIQGKKYHEGNIEGIGDLEQLAQEQGFGEIREHVTSQDELESVLMQILETPEDSKRMAKKLWKQMQENPTGVSMPRKEGNDYFYDKLVPKRLKEIAKKMGVKLEFVETLIKYPKSGNKKLNAGLKQMGIRITDELKEAAKKGWPTLGILGAMGASQIEKKIDKEPEEKNPLDQLFD